MSWQSLEIVRLTVKYGAEVALQELTASFQRGRVYLIIGANGSGKTTLMRAVCGLASSVDGVIEPKLNLDDWRNGYGVAGALPEDFGNYRDLNTRDVVYRVCRCRAKSRRLASELAEKTTAEIAGLLGSRALDTPQNELSGGQQRLIAITLALVLAPDVLVADEPFTGLDAMLAGWVGDQLSRHAKGGGLSIVTHNGDHQDFSNDWWRLELKKSGQSGRQTLILRI